MSPAAASLLAHVHASARPPAVSPAAAERARVAAVWRDWVPGILARQCRDGSVNDGGFAQDATGWYCGRHAAYTLARLMAARLWAEELAIDAGCLDAACVRTLAFLGRRQAADGSLDLGGMYSSNEVGFPLTGLALAWRRYEAGGIAPGPRYLDDLLAFCVRGGEALLAGSALTANHRWAAVSAPLAALNLIRPDSRYLNAIETLLSHGLDLNADGCWEHERSPNYNIVASQGVLALADTLGRGELLAPLVNHGEFVLHSLQPDGEMDSTISHRQDRAQAGCAAISYGVARRLALIADDGRFTALAEQAWAAHPEPERELVPLPLQLDAQPGSMPAPKPLPVHYEVFFHKTGQARIRTPRTAVSFSCDTGGHFFDMVRDRWGGVKHSDDWFHLHHGGVVIESLVVAAAGMQNVQPGVLRRVDAGRYELEADQPGWDHTLHFAPGSPGLRVRWDWCTRITAAVNAAGVSISLNSTTPKSLIASLHWRVRAGLTLHLAGAAPRLLEGGDAITLPGGSPVCLEAADGSSVTISGLPVAAHRFPVIHPPAIPSRMAESCATLSLGLRFPVACDFHVSLSN